MKLYTKKMTYSLLAIGFLACAPVDAAAIATAYSASSDKPLCKRMCRGYFVDDANNKNLTGVIKKRDIYDTITGKANNICSCEYKGDLDIDKKKDFTAPRSSHLLSVAGHADSRKCDRSLEMCLVKK